MKEFLKTNYDLSDKNLISVIDELPLWSAPFGLKLLEIIKLKKNISALDIGFGTGFPMLETAMRLGDSSIIYGIDPWDAAAERAMFKAKIYEINNVKFLNGTAEEIPLPDKTVDLIFSNNGINNVIDINKSFSECSRISKPGAQFVFSFNLDKTMIEFYNVFEKVLYEKGMITEIANIKEHIYKKRKPVAEIKNLAAGNGFFVRNIYEEQFTYRFTDGTSMLKHFLIKLAFLESWRNLVPEKRQNEIYSEIENQLNVLAEDEGELKLTIPFAVFDCEKSS